MQNAHTRTIAITFTSLLIYIGICIYNLDVNPLSLPPRKLITFIVASLGFLWTIAMVLSVLVIIRDGLRDLKTRKVEE